MNNFKKVISFSIFLIIVNLNLLAQINVGHPDYFIYSDKDYLNTNSMYHVGEGPSGLIYVSTILGIYEYDGREWRWITDDIEEIKGVIHSFAVDPITGIIYLGVPGEIGYLQPNKRGQWEYISINKQVEKELGKFSDVWNVRLIDDVVFFQTYNKLIKYNIKKKNVKIWEAKTFFSLTGVVDNQLYVGQSEKGLYTVKEDSLILLSDHEKLLGMLFYNIIPYNETHILLTSTNDAVFIDKKDFKPDDNYNFLINKLKPVLKSRIYNIGLLDNNRFAITTYYNGLYILDSLFNIISVYNKEDGFPINMAWYVTQAKSGKLWLALDNGLVKINSEEHFVFFDKNKYLNNRLTSIYEYEGKLLLGTSEGLYKLNIDNINNLTIEETGINFSVWDMEEFIKEKGKDILLFPSDEGIWEYKNGKFNKIVEQLFINSITISKFYPRRVYFSYNRGVSYIENKDNGWTKPVKISDIRMCYKIIEDSTGKLWFHTGIQGIFLLKDVAETNDSLYKAEEIFIDSSGVNIYDAFLLKDTLILATSKGVYKYEEKINKFAKDSILFKFENEELKLFNVLKISDSEIWAAVIDKEVSYLLHYYMKKGSFEADFKNAPFFKYKSINRIYKESRGRIWLSLSGKLVLLKDLEQYKKDSSEYNVLIREVRINNDSVIFHGTNFIETENGIIMNNNGYTFLDKPVNYKYNNISFEFSAPFFEKEWSTQYSFMLDGYEDKWSDWSHENRKEYTNLREGSYTFKVKALNVFNKESNCYAYNFTINPPYYRSIYAYSIYTLLIAFIVSFTIWYSRTKHQREKDKLESIITQRTSKILSQKQKIENQAKLLGNANQQLHKLSIVASKVDNPVIICDTSGKIEWVNDSYCKYFNKEQEEMINSNYNLLDICFNRNVYKFFDTCIKEKRPVTYAVNASEVRVKKDLWMQTTLTPILDHMDNVINIIAISSDITYLHELNNTRDMVISVITHDLKSPLLAFKIISGNLLKKLAKVDKAMLEENLRELYSHSSEIYEFLQYLSDWLKSQSGSLTFFPHTFKISKTLDEVINLFKISSKHKKIDLVNKIPKNVEVFADENMIKTVLRNLLSNAIKFSKVGDNVTIYSKKVKDKLIISVSDNGIGIDVDKKEKVFTLGESSGLGLVISKEFVQKNKGEIWLEDKEKGVLINFSIPCS